MSFIKSSRAWRVWARVTRLVSIFPLYLPVAVAHAVNAGTGSTNRGVTVAQTYAMNGGLSWQQPDQPPQPLIELGPAGPARAKLKVDDLVRRVLRENPGITAMRAAAEAAHARVESAGALDDPMLSYAAAPRTAGGPRQGLNQNVQISQKIPWPGTLRLRTRAAAANATSSDADIEDIRLRLAARARAVYAQWFYVHRALRINAENRVLLKRLHAVAEASYASGQSPQQDVLQAQVEQVRLRNQALELKRLQRTVQARINVLQNRAPDTPVAAPEDLPQVRALPGYASLRDTALSRYPKLQSLDARIDASQDRLALARKNRYPQFNLMAGYNSLWDAPVKRLVVGVSINIPFGANHSGEISAAQAHVRQAQAALIDVRSRLLGDLEQAYATAEQARTSIQLYREQLLPLARLNLQAAEADYSNGSGDFLKLITAERQYLAVKLELARTRADFYTQWASLDYRTGGALASQSMSAMAQDAKQ